MIVTASIALGDERAGDFVDDLLCVLRVRVDDNLASDDRARVNVVKRQ